MWPMLKLFLTGKVKPAQQKQKKKISPLEALEQVMAEDTASDQDTVSYERSPDQETEDQATQKKKKGNELQCQN